MNERHRNKTEAKDGIHEAVKKLQNFNAFYLEMPFKKRTFATEKIKINKFYQF